MSDSDALENNPNISRAELAAIHEHIFGWALSRTNYDRAVAEDLVQQAYVELMTGKARFDNRSSLQTFVFSVVQNLARSRLRRTISRLRFVQRAGREVGDAVAEPLEPSQNAAVWKAVQALPPRQRDIVELVFCRDMTIEAAAAVMGVSTGTGRVHYDRAKKALKNTLGDYGVKRDA